MTALKWITTEAKKLKKQYPKRFAKWTDYVAQASAIYASKHKGKSPVGKKKVGALPVGFTGKIWGVNFKIVNQFDIYNEVKAIVEDTTTGSVIVTFDGKKNTKDIVDLFTEYIIRHRTTNYNFDDKDKRQLKSRLTAFCTNMQKEVKDYNAGKKATIKKQPINIEAPKHKKIPATKKVSVKKSSVKKPHTHWKKVKAHERRVNGVTKKSPARSYGSNHKDTKSHNVNIRVVSGIKDSIKEIEAMHERIAFQQGQLEALQNMLRYEKFDIKEKKRIMQNIKLVKLRISDYKKHLTSLKRHI